MSIINLQLGYVAKLSFSNHFFKINFHGVEIHNVIDEGNQAGVGLFEFDLLAEIAEAGGTGFSQKTCFPVFNAAIDCGPWNPLGLTSQTASMSVLWIIFS